MIQIRFADCNPGKSCRHILMENEHQVISEDGYLLTDEAGGDYKECSKMVGKYVVGVKKDLVRICKSSEDLTKYGFINIDDDTWINKDKI